MSYRSKYTGKEIDEAIDEARALMGKTVVVCENQEPSEGDVLTHIGGKNKWAPPSEPPEDGGYYVPEVDILDAKTIKISFTASNDGMPSIDPVEVALPSGADGATITDVYQVGTSNTRYTYRMDMSDGTYHTFFVPVGPAGVGIERITVNADGSWRITYDDGTSTTVTNDALAHAIGRAENAVVDVRAALEQMNDAKKGKLDKSGWIPNMYLGTDEDGSVVTKTAPGGSGADGSATVYRATDYGISTDSEDNTPALQALIDQISAAGGGIIFFPVGTYAFKRYTSSDYRWAIEMKSHVSIIGENLETTVLKQTQPDPYSLFGRILADGAGADDPLTGCTFSNFTVDAYETGDRNHVCGKAFFFQFVRDCVFRDLRLMGTTATAMGIDFIDRVVIDNVTCIDCGRTFTGNEAGTSGIGIGTAGWENENFIITNCVCDGCGQYGIFIENQGIFHEGNVPYAKGCVISNCIVRNGINKGIGVRGGQNVTVIGCESYENTSHGIYIDNNCKNVKVISCSGANNGGSGILIEPNNTEHLLVKGCTFVNNQADGITVSVAAGKNANKLCIADCYTDGNTVGMNLTAASLFDCVIMGNATLDGIANNATFAGNTSFNDILGGGDAPVVTEISIPFSSLTNGMKLMPDGSYVEGEAGANFTTEYYIDVSKLNDAFELICPAGLSKNGVRIAQYDASKNSLSDSFTFIEGFETDENSVWQTTKLEGCQYVRVFLSGGFNNVDGVLRNAAAEDDPTLEEITILSSSLRHGMKLMPDGSETTQDGGAITEYIDVSTLGDTFEIVYPGNGQIRTAQYDSSRNSLGDSFGLNAATSSADGQYIWQVTKLEGCRYIRLFLSGAFGDKDGIVRNASAT